MLLEILLELLADDRRDRRADFRGDQLVLRLVRVLRIGALDGDDRGQTFAKIVAGETAAALALLQQLVLGRVVVDGARQRLAEARGVRAAIAVLDRVREAGEEL